MANTIVFVAGIIIAIALWILVGINESQQNFAIKQYMDERRARDTYEMEALRSRIHAYSRVSLSSHKRRTRSMRLRSKKEKYYEM